MLLLIDNYDSFTWNLYQFFCELGSKVIVIRNDEFSIKEISLWPITHIVISPGPGNPSSTGISLSVIKYYAGLIPILGVCLGHQAIAQLYGAKIIKASKVMHGKMSTVYHNNCGIFHNIIKNPINVVLYNSLIVSLDNLPECLEITAWNESKGKKDVIMGIRHKKFIIEGIQFHPESILSEQGHKILENFLLYK